MQILKNRSAATAREASGNRFALQMAANDLTFGVNVKGMMRFSQSVIPHMQTAGVGSIVNIASLCGLRNIPPTPPCYTASKFAVIGMTKAIAQEFGASNIRCNAICPGSVATQMQQQVVALLAEEHNISAEEAEALELNAIPMGRAAHADDIADVAVFLASNLSRYMTGVALPVAGGMSPGL